MKLDNRIRELIAVGTAVGANCHPCLEYHVRRAREVQVPDDEVAEAIDVGKLVRRGAQGKIDKLAADLIGQATQSQTSSTQGEPASAGCGCGA